MGPEIRDMKWAIVASQHRSLRQAAETLNVRQSTLSRCLRDLEHEVGVELFERTNGGTRPTLVGREFLEAAQRIVEDTDNTLRRLRAHGRGESGSLKIGVCSSFSAGNLYATLLDYRRQMKDVDIHTIEGVKDRLLGELSAGAIDVAIATGCCSSWSDRLLSLWSERVIVALPEQHPLSDHPVIRWHELSDDRILLTQRGVDPELEKVLVAKFNCPGRPRILYQDVGFDRLLSLTATGYGDLLVLESAAGLSCAGVIYRELHDENGPARLHFAAYWRESNDNPTLKPFLKLLRDRYPDLSVVPE